MAGVSTLNPYYFGAPDQNKPICSDVLFRYGKFIEKMKYAERFYVPMAFLSGLAIVRK